VTTPLGLFVLLAIYQFKHFIADFILQNNYMLKKIRPGWDFILPLALHCLLHAVLTLLICLYYRPSLWWLALVDFGVHFATDRFRSGPRYLGRYNDVHQTIFWWILGLDQLIHHLTHLWIVWMIVFH